MDNKGNVYTRSYSDVSYEDIKDSGLNAILEMIIQRRNGSGQKIRCLARKTTHFLSEDM